MNENRYIDIFDECYDKLNSVGRETTKMSLRRSSFKYRFMPQREFEKLEESTCKSAIDSAISDCQHKIDDFIDSDFLHSENNISRSYRQLWEFCQFVRYAEKVIFYKNTLESDLYVDTKIDAVDKREFLLNGDEFKIYFHLESKKDNILDANYNIINIKVHREFGKKLINEYTIINQEVNLNSLGDTILINTINNILYDATLNTFNSIMKKLFNFFKERVRWEKEQVIS